MRTRDRRRGDADSPASFPSSPRESRPSVIQRDNPARDREQIRLHDVWLSADEQGCVTGTRYKRSPIPRGHRPQGIPGVCRYEPEQPGLDAQFSRHETVRLTRWFVSFDFVHGELTLEIVTQSSLVEQSLAHLGGGIRERHHPEPRTSKALEGFRNLRMRRQAA